MFRGELLSGLICPYCGGEIRQTEPDQIRCTQCSKTYLVKENIPIVLRNPEKVLSEIGQRAESKPDWYKSEQIRYAEQGPYRHHLRKRVAYIQGVIKKRNITSPKILDVGCGDGFNLKHLVTVPNSIVFGIDYNFIRLSRAQKLTNGQSLLLLGDILESNLKSNYFDIILCNHVLEHIENDLAVLHNLNRLLKVDGLFILGVPNEGALLWRLERVLIKLIKPQIIQATDHVHFYTVKQVLEVLQKTRFTTEEVKYIGWGVPGAPIDAFLRQYKRLDDLFETIGKWFCKTQATSLYFICTKR